ncbi:MAG: hydrolase [Cyanobacteriota bacterium]
MHKKILDQNNSLLLIIDIQEKFKNIIYNSEKVIENTIKLVKTANWLEIPVVYTEQYPKGIGPTVEEIKQHLDKAKYFDKLTFSCCGNTEFISYLKSTGKNQIIVCGIETHICVNQTVHGLLENNFIPHLIIDAVGSRVIENLEVGINKMRDSGAVISCLEMCLFELMDNSKHPYFKDIQKLII